MATYRLTSPMVEAIMTADADRRVTGPKGTLDALHRRGLIEFFTDGGEILACLTMAGESEHMITTRSREIIAESARITEPVKARRVCGCCEWSNLPDAERCHVCNIPMPLDDSEAVTEGRGWLVDAGVCSEDTAATLPTWGVVKMISATHWNGWSGWLDALAYVITVRNEESGMEAGTEPCEHCTGTVVYGPHKSWHVRVRTLPSGRRYAAQIHGGCPSEGYPYSPVRTVAASEREFARYRAIEWSMGDVVTPR